MNIVTKERLSKQPEICSMQKRPYFGLEVPCMGRRLLVALLKVVFVAPAVPELVVVVLRVVLVPTCERQQ
jgi:hypothetical protein